jgi:hypothetical protein
MPLTTIPNHSSNAHLSLCRFLLRDCHQRCLSYSYRKWLRYNVLDKRVCQTKPPSVTLCQDVAEHQHYYYDLLLTAISSGFLALASLGRIIFNYLTGS